VGGLHSSLGYGVRHQEEVKGAVYYLRLLHEAFVNIGALRRVGDACVGTNLEESLPNSLVDDDQGVLWQRWLFGWVKAILLLHYLRELLELVGDDLGPHRVTNSISVDEDVVWELALVVVSESLESALEVLLEHARADDLLTFLTLRARLSIVLAHMLIIGGAEANDALLALVADVDTDEHGLPRDLSAKVEAPEVTTELGVDLPEDVDVDPVVVLLDGLARDELGDDRAVGVDLVLQCRVEVLLLDRVWHDNKEEVEVLGLSGLGKLSTVCVFAANILEVVVVDRLLEGLDSGLVAELNDVSVVEVDVKAPLL